MGNGVLHRGPLAPRGPSTRCLHLGAQLLLERLVLTEAEAAALPARGFCPLSAQGTRVTRHRRTLDILAWDQGGGWSMGTGHPPSREVQGELLLGEQRTTLRPGAGDPVHARLRPLSHPGAGHGPQVESELQQAWSWR